MATNVKKPLPVSMVIGRIKKDGADIDILSSTVGTKGLQHGPGGLWASSGRFVVSVLQSTTRA